MTKSDAKAALDKILASVRVSQDAVDSSMSLGQFVEHVYLPFYKRKWKRSTAECNVNRVNKHVMSVFSERPLSALHRGELQDFLDGKAAAKLSFSVVAHLRWDLRQIFGMAVAEGLLARNPAVMLFTPGESKRGPRLVMTKEEVKKCLTVLDLRERLIVAMATLAGMRPGEIFGLTWQHIGSDHADIRQRVYRGDIDRPKTVQSIRRAALSDGLIAGLSEWRKFCVDTRPGAWVFASERGTPLSRDNFLRRCLQPKLEEIGLAWVNFQVMRRTHSTLMNGMGVEPKLVADQLGHGLDVNQNVYTQTPVERRKVALDQLETALVM
jgi:integrase